MTGISLPILIHLWNTRKSKTRLVGSVLFFDQAPEKKAWLKRISDPLQLLIRCLLIIAVSVLLAKPFLKSGRPNTNKRGWVLLGREDLPKIYHQFRPTIDSLIRLGYESRYFEANFPRFRLEEALNEPKDSTAPISYWNIAETISKFPADSFPVFIFTNNRLQNFFGPRPQGRSLSWHIYNSIDSNREWVSDAWVTPQDSVAIRKMNSDSNHLLFHTAVLSKQEFARSKEGAVKVDTGTMNIAIVAEQGKMEGAYLKAALDAIARFGKRKIRIQFSDDARQIPAAKDWVFWLSQQKPVSRPAAKNFFYYDSGKVISRPSVIISVNDMFSPIQLYQVLGDHPENTSGKVLWTDGFGAPLLRRIPVNDNTDYCFNSRLDPAFNDLPWSSALPQFLYKLLYEKDDAILPAADQRTIDPRQLQFNTSGIYEANALNLGEGQSGDVSKYVWILVFALFMLERLLSFFKQKNKLHAS